MMAVSMGINYIAIPPHWQSLNCNEAERIADRLWTCARIFLISTGAIDSLFVYGMDNVMGCYVKLSMATSAHRNWLTAYESLSLGKPTQHRPPLAVLDQGFCSSAQV